MICMPTWKCVREPGYLHVNNYLCVYSFTGIVGLVAAMTEKPKVALAFAIIFSIHTVASAIASIAFLASADSSFEFKIKADAEDDVDEIESAVEIVKVLVFAVLAILAFACIALAIYWAFCFFAFYNELKRSAAEKINNKPDNKLSEADEIA